MRKVAELMVGGILIRRPAERATDPDGRPAARARSRWAGTGKFHDVNVKVRPRRDRRPVRACRLRRVGDRRLHLRHRPRRPRRDPARRQADRDPRSPRHAQQLGIALLPANRKLAGHVLLPVDRLQHLRRPPEAAVALRYAGGPRPGTHRRQGHDQAAGREDAAASGSRSARCPAATRRRSCWPASSSSGPRCWCWPSRPRASTSAPRRRSTGSSPSWPTNGTAVLVVTSDLPEALRISDRLQVVRGGTTTVEFGPDATQVDVLAAAAGDVNNEGRVA